MNILISYSLFMAVNAVSECLASFSNVHDVRTFATTNHVDDVGRFAREVTLYGKDLPGVRNAYVVVVNAVAKFTSSFATRKSTVKSCSSRREFTRD